MKAISTLAVLAMVAIAQRPSPVKPEVLLPRAERLLQWSPQQRPVGFRNMEKIAPVRRVAHGATPMRLPYAESTLEVSYVHKGRQWDTDQFMEGNDVAGLIVVRDGRILVERYALGFDDRSLWTSFSVAKSITSTLLGAAIADGHIRSVDDGVVRYLPALRGTAYDGVTIRQILTMTSGVKWNEDYDDPESDVNRCHRATDLLTCLTKLPREAPAGSRWVYKTGETDLVGELVAAATGRPLADYLSEKIWAKVGMERDAYWMLRGGKELGGCCLSMSLRDYARFGLFTLKPDSTLPSGWMQQAVAPSPAASHYGFQWWVGVDGPGTWSARGIFGQSIHVNPADRLVIVILSAWPTPLDKERREAEQAFRQAVTARGKSLAKQ